MDILYESEELYVLSCAGNVWFFRDGEPVWINGEAEGGCTAVAVWDKTLFRFSQREHTLYSGQNDVEVLFLYLLLVFFIQI